jgi:phosphoribosylformimino-5-aminoimidazole carboxamide ribotide isomerase
MRIIPAIDLWSDNVVRLYRGDINQSKVYSTDPVETALKWEKEGAHLLHIVDLSAAFGKGEDHMSAIGEILSTIKIPVQVGGGIRSVEKARALIDMGAQRIIVGTRSIEEEFLNDLVDGVGADRVAVGVDTINGVVAVKGWTTKTDLRGDDFVLYLNNKGIKWVIYTDISRDGTMQGPNIAAMNHFADLHGINFIASGGVASLDDLKRLKEEAPFVWGVIAGKALYEKAFTVKEANALLDS